MLYPSSLAKDLVLDELFDLTLYKRLHPLAPLETKKVLEELIPVEVQHFTFWKTFFKQDIDELDFLRKFKMEMVVAICYIFGAPAIHLVLEAIEVHGIRKYLQVWEAHKGTPLGKAVKEVLQDEFQHEDDIVSHSLAQRISGNRIRNIFLGFNDGLVEVLGAVSGFFAAFSSNSMVLAASMTVAIAGSISMAAGVFVAENSEKEVLKMEQGRSQFLRKKGNFDLDIHPLKSAIIVGISYIIGSLVPVLPVFLGSHSIVFSVIAGAVMILLVSYVLAFLSGMDARRRMLLNLAIIIFAVCVSYAIGALAKLILGISI